MALSDYYEQHQIEALNAGQLMMLTMLTESHFAFDQSKNKLSDRRGETFELMLLSAWWVMIFCDKKYGEDHAEKLKEELFIELEGIYEDSLKNEIPCRFDDFWNIRMNSIQQEFSHEENTVKLPSTTSYNIAIKPFQLKNNECNDIEEIMNFQFRTIKYYQVFIKRCEEILIEKISG